MASGNGPMTGAERQRAFRERKKRQAKQRPSNVIAIDGGEPPEGGDEELEEVSLATLNARMRQMALHAFDDVGGVEYLKKVAAKNANTFLRFVGQFVSKDDGMAPGAFNIYVQRLTIEAGAAQAVRGVISSPVPEHISAEQRWLPGPLERGALIEQEPPDG